MYLDLADHNQLNKELADLNLNDYIKTPGKNVLDYIKSLPKVVYTMHMYEEEEFNLLQRLGFHFAKSVEYRHIFDHIISFLKSKYPKYEVNNLII